MKMQDLVAQLPAHLKQFIVPQNYHQYTPVNQAVWRYVMKQNVKFLTTHAHHSYLDGLEQCGIDTESIPTIEGMNAILSKIGWAAVAVDGFIPPNAFMEFQAHKVLVIAADIRHLEHIEYTPAPDIIHEAAGHAPIIANPDYAEYLRRLGAIGAKAIMSQYDIDLYEAIRKVSILKEACPPQPDALEKAEAELMVLQGKDEPLSEMAQLRNLQWWTVEYGLIGTLQDPKIYGAGLLSSIGESKWCLEDTVAKLPLSVEAVNQSFDITKPQPQLYVTPDFAKLMEVLEEFANTLSMRVGGARGLKKLIDTDMVGTVELSTGLQVSGNFSEIKLSDDNEVVFFATKGPTALAYREKELIGHGANQYPNGFCAPLGLLKNCNLAIENMTPRDLKAYNFYDGEDLEFEYQSGIKVVGKNVTGIRNDKGTLMLIQLKNCVISNHHEVLFDSKEEVFDLVVGTSILSAYAGAADSNSFPFLYKVSETQTIHTLETERFENKELFYLYSRVREMRVSNQVNDVDLIGVFQILKEEYPKEWLLAVEILELMQSERLSLSIINWLEEIKVQQPHLSTLISNGIESCKKGIAVT